MKRNKRNIGAFALVVLISLLAVTSALAEGSKEEPVCRHQSWDDVVVETCTTKNSTPGGKTTHIETEATWWIAGKFYAQYEFTWNGSCNQNGCRSSNIWRFTIDGEKYLLISIFGTDGKIKTVNKKLTSK